jgi:hypothetical protein
VAGNRAAFRPMSCRLLLPLAPACLVLLASCGTDSGSEAAVGPQPQQAYRVKSGDAGDDDFGRIQDKYGAINHRVASGGSADEAAQMNAQFEGELARHEFAAKNYEKKSFWGSRDYEKKVYGGDLGDGNQFRKGAREGVQMAREGTMMSREDARAFATREVETGAAREAGRSPVRTPSDAESDIRRRVYKQPEVLDLNSQRALTVEDTRRMLGR